MMLLMLQSGFVTPATDMLVKTPQATQTFREKLFQDPRIKDNDFYYDKGVETLYQRWDQDNNLMQRFEFREEVMKTAFRVFTLKTPNICEFVRLQLTQDTVGFTHRKFLKDMIDSASWGRDKSMENYTYFRLLNALANTEIVNAKKTPAEDDLRDYTKDMESGALDRLLFRWTRDMNGFCDLLCSLWVIFGQRNATTRNVGVVRP